jgi:ribulose 1,5-bisphosphate synthetase/thiazole synthase
MRTRREVLKGAALAAGMAAPAPSAQAQPRSRLAETEVLVVGGGPAGFGAAVGAAMAGARTLLIENHGFFGGVGSWCVGMPINQVRPEGKPRSKVHELLVSKLQAYGEQAVQLGQHQLYTNVDYLKVAMLDALDAAGVKYAVHLRAVDTIVQSGRVAGVVVATKNGLASITAPVTIDCTGDADVAFFAGAETMKESGSLAPSTLCLNVGNVSVEQVRRTKIAAVVKAARARYPLIPAGWSLGPVAGGHGYFINHGGTRDMGQLDCTDPFQFSEAECKSRRQALQMVQAMREFGGPDLAGIELTGTGPQIGVRETRRVKGVYVLTEDDALSGRTFEDAIAWRTGFLDIGFVRYESMKSHDVPYRAILPVKMEGLLTAGRSISASHVAAAAGKSMGNCMATGHAAGIAAALAVKRKVQPRQIRADWVRDALRADGVDLTMGGKPQPDVSGDRKA